LDGFHGGSLKMFKDTIDWIYWKAFLMSPVSLAELRVRFLFPFQEKE
jgi:hypothetical protein